MHTPLTEKTRNILDAQALALAKPGVRIINCARGGLVDEAASKKDFDAAVGRRLQALVARSKRRPMPAVKLEPLGAERRYVQVDLDPKTRVATLTVRAPEGAEPRNASWEIDQARFMSLDEARKLIHPDQAVFLDRLELHLK